MTADATEPQGQDDITPQGESTTITDVETPQGEIDPAELQAKLDKAVAESRKWEQRAKKDAAALADMKTKVSQMVEPEKVVSTEARLAELEAQLSVKDTETLRYKVAVEKGLPMNLAKRLVGGDEDELLADADALLAELNAGKPKAAAAKEGHNAGTSKPNLSPAELLKASAFGN